MKYKLMILALIFIGIMSCGTGHIKKHPDHDKQITRLQNLLSKRNNNWDWVTQVAFHLRGRVLGNGCVDSIKAETPNGDSVLLFISSKTMGFQTFYRKES